MNYQNKLQIKLGINSISWFNKYSTELKFTGIYLILLLASFYTANRFEMKFNQLNTILIGFSKLLFSIIVLAVMYILYPLIYKTDIHSSHKTYRKFTGKTFILGTLVTMIFFLVLHLIVMPLVAQAPSLDLKEVLFSSSSSSTSLLPWFLGSTFIAPIQEEFIFRKVILGNLLKKCSNTEAIIISSLLFGLVHLNLQQFINAFSSAIILGYWYSKTDSFKFCLWLHMLNNFIVCSFCLFIM